ncbi:MAG: hypothetical protein ABF293_12395 [Flavobacteriaceae bacterium]
MKRRIFTQTLGKGIVLIGMSDFVLACAEKTSDTTSWKPEELSKLCSREKLVSLGLTYRELSGENNRDTLIGLLSKNFSGNSEEQKKYLSALVSDDFRTDQTVLIDGWLLSRTEARQCAILSFSSE